MVKNQKIFKNVKEIKRELKALNNIIKINLHKQLHGVQFKKIRIWC